MKNPLTNVAQDIETRLAEMTQAGDIPRETKEEVATLATPILSFLNDGESNDYSRLHSMAIDLMEYLGTVFKGKDIADLPKCLLVLFGGLYGITRITELMLSLEKAPL